MTYVESIFKRLKGKFVEVYSGDTSLTRYYSDYDTNTKDVVRGVVVDADGDVLMIEVMHSETHEKNIAYLNGWSIRNVVEPKNGISIVDMYHGEAARVKK